MVIIGITEYPLESSGKSESVLKSKPLCLHT